MIVRIALGHRGGVGAARVAGADRPDRLVGDDQPGRDGRRGAGRAARRGAGDRRRLLVAGLALGQLLADAQDRAQAGVDGTAELPADQLVGLPASRRRSEWPMITHVARPASMGAEISPV